MSRLNKRELQRLTEDEEVMDAVETLRLWGVDGAVYDKLIHSDSQPPEDI